MFRTRLLFEKTGRAQYISHLDLLRTFQRVFLRSGIALRHTEGFNPHPYMSFALPLSVGVSSICELLDVDLAAEAELLSLPSRLNDKMPEGIKALRAYRSESRFAELAHVRLEGRFDYDAGVRDGLTDELTLLFRKSTLMITKKTKKGFIDFNLAPCVQSIHFSAKTLNEVTVEAVVTAQNPSVNPENLVTAVRMHLPDCAPDFAAFRRTEVYDKANAVFR